MQVKTVLDQENDRNKTLLVYKDNLGNPFGPPPDCMHDYFIHWEFELANPGIW